MTKYKVGVVFGSRSTEHEVSVVTAVQTMEFLSGRHEVIPIYITKGGQWLTGQKLTKLDTYRNLDPKDSGLQTVIVTGDPTMQVLLDPMPRGLFSKPKKLDLDIIFPVVHGMHGEDGTLQGLLDLADIPYVGSGVLGSAIGIDKIMTKAVLKENGLPVLDYLWFTRADWEQDSQKVIDRVLERFSFPVIVKPSRLGSTIGIQKATSAEELTFAIDAAIHYDHRALVEPYIRNRTEINCAVLGNSDPIPSACEQPVSRDALLSYQDKYLHNQSDRGMEGATRIIPAPISVDLTKRIQDLAVDAFRAIGGLGIARVDFLMDVDSTRVYVNELNTMPGSIAYYLWEPTGIKPQQLVDRLLDLAVEAYRDKRKNTYTFATPLLQQSDLLKLRKG